MKRVPRKNISGKLTDVKAPDGFPIKEAPAPNNRYELARSKGRPASIAMRSIAGRPMLRARVFSKEAEESGVNIRYAAMPVKDVAAPKENLDDSLRLFAPRKKMETKVREKKFFKYSAFLAAAVVVAGAIYGVYIFRFSSQAAGTARKIFENLQSSAEHMRNLEPGKAKESLESADRQFSDVKSNAGRFGVLSIGEYLGSVWPTAKKIPETFNSVGSVLKSLVALSSNVEELKANGLGYFTGGDGRRLISLLDDMSVETESVAKEGASILNTLNVIKQLPIKTSWIDSMPNGAGGFDQLTQLYAASDFLSALSALLKKPEGFHFALFFENPSEMRPSGGFIGSYADLTVRGGSLAGMDVRDIYDPDGQLDKNYVPPKAIQGMTTRWGARDANWFFDFPTSAKKVLDFLEMSKIYSEKQVAFDGALSLNTDVLGDLLNITGPIELPDYKLTISKDNFLEEVQKEVETGTNKAIHQPKKILRDLTPKLLERLKGLSDGDRGKLLELLKSRIDKKDIQVYFRDPKLEEFAVKFGAAGEIFKESSGFVGDYLAVVNANVAGGKTDVYINQDISLKSQIDGDGVVTNELKITRTHTGDKAKYWWYRSVNQDYMQVYVPEGAKLSAILGASKKTVWPQVNYSKASYATDTDVAANESGAEFGKSIWNAWVTTEAGESKTVKFTYQGPDRVELKSGNKYTFVFDRQSGVRGGINLELEAPAGFIWKESGKQTYEYESDNPGSRVLIPLTIARL